MKSLSVILEREENETAEVALEKIKKVVDYAIYQAEK